MNDIQGRNDIKKLVDEFYKKVLQDKIIGFIFSQSVAFIWAKHVPIMYEFWDSTLFYTSAYKGNPMLLHIKLNAKIELTDERFHRWLSLWNATIDENFSGDKATEAKEKALMIADLMKFKIRSNRQIDNLD